MSASKRREREIVCAKKCYHSEEAAQAALDKMTRTADQFGYAVPIRYYYCRQCGYLHLTKKPFVEMPKEKEDGEI